MLLLVRVGSVIGKGDSLEVLHDGAHVGMVARWRAGLVEDFALGRRKDTADAIDKLQGILLGPEVDV